jgi:hypothetical protein
VKKRKEVNNKCPVKMVKGQKVVAQEMAEAEVVGEDQANPATPAQRQVAERAIVNSKQR